MNMAHACSPPLGRCSSQTAWVCALGPRGLLGAAPCCAGPRRGSWEVTSPPASVAPSVRPFPESLPELALRPRRGDDRRPPGVGWGRVGPRVVCVPGRRAACCKCGGLLFHDLFLFKSHFSYILRQSCVSLPLNGYCIVICLK